LPRVKGEGFFWKARAPRHCWGYGYRLSSTNNHYIKQLQEFIFHAVKLLGPIRQ
jgi:hypothetical protein